MNSLEIDLSFFAQIGEGFIDKGWVENGIAFCAQILPQKSEKTLGFFEPSPPFWLLLL